MFGFSSGKSSYPTVYTVQAVKKTSKKDTPPSPPAQETTSSPDSLEPAIDGPPSPERIRAYTEQMKRSSIFGNNSRTNTFSSATSSFRSRESTSTSTDNVSLSRKSSNRSTSSSMPSLRSDRPESSQIFGSIFSRGGRKSRRANTTSSLASSTSSIAIEDSVIEEGSAKDHYYGRRSNSRRRQLISGPYNFQHVTHTRQEHLPNLERTSRMELVSEFSAIRASQVPTHGELKGIRAEDLHFENFSSEALGISPSDEDHLGAPKSPRRRVLRKSLNQPQRTTPHAKSHDNLKVAPPRPPRSPLSPTCPVALPARTSSRTASILFDTFDPLATTTIERPYTSAGFRKPAPFNITVPPPTWDGLSMSHAVTTPAEEAWPLTASPSGNFGIELADVQEEEEDVASRRSRFSTASAELRMSQSVPALRRKSQDQAHGADARVSTILGQPSSAQTSPQKAQPVPGFQLASDSWESDIDWCYDHEVEADCDYQWDRCSMEETANPSSQAQQSLQLRVQTEERTYHGRFRPSLLVPSPLDLPELSPMSNSSTPSSDPRTPANFLRTNHLRSPSHASSFKESHGFHLSPTLLIPADFQSQMDQDALYNEHFSNNVASATIFPQESYNHPISPVDEGASSTASYRSSNFSRGSASARSSSSTRISGLNSRGSQDSMMLLGRSGSLTGAHRSIGSASSLPDLIPSALRQSDTEIAYGVASMGITDYQDDSAPAPEIGAPGPALASLQHRRNLSLAMEQGRRKGENHFAPPILTIQQKDIEGSTALSPVAEIPLPTNEFKDQPLAHERKTSAPVVSPSVREFKGRARSATTASTGKKGRGSYMLFPQI